MFMKISYVYMNLNTNFTEARARILMRINKFQLVTCFLKNESTWNPKIMIGNNSNEKIGRTHGYEQFKAGCPNYLNEILTNVIGTIVTRAVSRCTNSFKHKPNDLVNQKQLITTMYHRDKF